MNNYVIRKGYQINSYLKSSEARTSEAFRTEDNIRLSRFSQYPVYAEAYRIAREQGIHTVLDIGCGSGRQLMHYFGNRFDVFGIDQASGIELCRENYSEGTFIVEDIEQPGFEVRKHVKSFPLIICADVIEHLQDPDKLCAYIKSLSNEDTTVILSTVERHAMAGKKSVRPESPCHVREWNSHEFRKYIEHSGFHVLAHENIFPFLWSAGSLWPMTKYVIKKAVTGRGLRTTQLMVLKSCVES